MTLTEYCNILGISVVEYWAWICVWIFIELPLIGYLYHIAYTKIERYIAKRRNSKITKEPEQ